MVNFNISLIVSKDKKEITYFVDQHWDMFYGMAYTFLQNGMESEEVAQDSIMKAINNISTYTTEKSFKAWCYTIVRNTSIDYIRKRKKIVSLDSVTMMPSTNNTSEISEKNDIVQLTHDLLNKLDEESRELMLLYYISEKNIQEISDMTSLSVSNIKIKLYRSRQKMLEYAKQNINIADFT